MSENTLARAMTEARARLFPQASRLIPVLQVTGVLQSNKIELTLSEARNQTLRWIQNRSQRLPGSAWSYESFELEYGGTGAVSLKENNTDYWVARLVDPDKNIAGRTWTTEISVVESNDTAHFGLKQVVQTREGELAFTPTIPGVLRQISTECGLEVDGRTAKENPWILKTNEELDDLFSLIYSQTRRLPVYIVTLNERENNPKNAVLDVDNLAMRCLGLAHVIVVPGPLTFLLTDQFDRQFSVFRGAVRTYLPKFDQYSDSPYDHPLALPERIANWGDRGAADFIDFLVQKAAVRSRRHQRREEVLPSFIQVKEAVTRRRRIDSAEAGSDFEEQLSLAQLEIEELEQDRDAWQDIAASEEQARQEVEKRNSELESDLFRFRHRIFEFEELLKSQEGISVEIDIPQTYSEIKEWSERTLGGRVILTGKAYRAAKSGQFEDISLSYKALLMMANEYWKMKTIGGQDHINEFRQKLEDLGLENSRTGEKTKLHVQGDEFLVTWRGSKRLLEWHLKNNVSRSPEKSFRLYYFWDDENQQTIVGSLPSHLRTRLT